MGSITVSVFGRIKPRAANIPVQDYSLKCGDNEDQITFTAKTGKKVFRFQKIFSEDATQEQIFDVVARPVIQNIFQGYNGTIFTYGQTGSGKTHTMAGLPEFQEMGLIPRTLQEIFKKKESNTVISIAYFEIYNEHIYDLVRRKTPDYEAKDFILHDTNITSFRNLSVHVVNSAVDAMQLFQTGDKNKMVAETNSNINSSRSHVIFSISFEIPHPKEDTLSLKPVLYLVDLAGSERISKTGGSPGNPRETRHINLSLHYLEQVLVALREPGRIHIPYRNSLMTALLKNSLGGNCHTTMIATLSMSVKNIDDTLQTCRFAERIALIRNEMKLTAVTIPHSQLQSLKKENEFLRAQLSLITEHQFQEELNEGDKQQCQEMVRTFIQEDDIFALPLLHVRRMEFCCKLMRHEILKLKAPPMKALDESGSVATLQRNSSKHCVEGPRLKMSSSEKFEVPRRGPLRLPKVNISYKNEFTERENILPVIENSKSPQKKIKKQNCSEEIQEIARKMASSVNSFGNDSPRRKSFNLDLTCSDETKTKNVNLVHLKTNVTKEGVVNSPKNSGSLESMNKVLSHAYQNFFDKIESHSPKNVLQKNPSREKSQLMANLPLTGDREVDEEILKFYESRSRFFSG